MGMGAQDYRDLQRSRERRISKDYRWTRNALVAGALTAVFFYADTQTTLAREMVQRVTDSPGLSVPYWYRLEGFVENTWNQANDLIAPYIK